MIALATPLAARLGRALAAALAPFRPVPLAIPVPVRRPGLVRPPVGGRRF